MLNMIRHWRRERSAVTQLSRLSDRELADLGIQRRDIKTVARFASATALEEGLAIVEPAFAFADLVGSRHVAPANAPYRPTSLAA